MVQNVIYLEVFFFFFVFVDFLYLFNLNHVFKKPPYVKCVLFVFFFVCVWFWLLTCCCCCFFSFGYCVDEKLIFVLQLLFFYGVVRHSKACENNPNCVHGIVQSNSSFEVNPKSKGDDDDGDDGNNKKSASRKRSNEVKSKRGRPSKRGRAHEADDGSDSFHLEYAYVLLLRACLFSLSSLLSTAFLVVFGAFFFPF